MTRWILPIAILLSASACQLPDSDAGTAPPNPAPVATQAAPAPAPAPRSVANDPDWQNWPLADGKWFYTDQANRSEAGYIADNQKYIFGILCDKTSRSITLTLHDVRAGISNIIFATSFGRQNMAASFGQDSEGQFAKIALSANNLLLDQMIFSRGSIGLLVEKEPAMRIRTSAEMARTIEDCR